MTRYLLFGWRRIPLDRARRLLEEATTFRLELHESDYKGGEYYRTPVGFKPEAILQRNWIDEDGYLAERTFDNHITLLYLNDPPPTLVDAVDQITESELLRSEEV